MMTSECVFQKICIFIIFHIKEYPVKYDVVTNDDLFEVYFKFTKFKLHLNAML